MIGGAGHHVFADQPELFNKLVNNLCNKIDNEEDVFIINRGSSEEEPINYVTEDGDTSEAKFSDKFKFG